MPEAGRIAAAYHRLFLWVWKATMSDNQRVLQAIYRAVDEVNLMLPEGEQIRKSTDTELIGLGSEVDSLTVVNLVVETEQAVLEAFGVPVILSDEKAMSAEPSPFGSIGALAGYLQTLLPESGG